MAGGSYHDICGLFGLGPGGFFSEKRPLWPTLYAIHEALASEIVFDISEMSCRKSADGFLLASRGQIDGCVCAIDGLVIKTRKPTSKEPPSRMEFDVQTGDVPQVIFNAERHNGSRLEGLRRSRRQEITQTLTERGVARP